MKYISFFLLVIFSINTYYVFGYSKPNYFIHSKMVSDTIQIVNLKNKIYGKNKFKIVELRDIELEHRKIIVLKNDTVMGVINLPNQDDYQGFSLNWIKESKTGFNVSFEYGTKKYYSKDFYFCYIKDNFYLVKIKVQSFDMSKPEKETNKVLFIKPYLLFRKFKLENYL